MQTQMQNQLTTRSSNIAPAIHDGFFNPTSFVHEILKQPDLSRMIEYISTALQADTALEQPRGTEIVRCVFPVPETSQRHQEIPIFNGSVEIGVLKISARTSSNHAELISAALVHPMLRVNDRQSDHYRQFGNDLNLIIDGHLRGQDLRSTLRRYRLDPDRPVSVITTRVAPSVELFFGDHCTIAPEHPFAVGLVGSQYFLLIQETNAIRAHAEHLLLHVEHSQTDQAAVGIGNAPGGGIDLRTALLESKAASGRGIGINERSSLTMQQILSVLPTDTLRDHATTLLLPIIEHDAAKQSNLMHSLIALTRHNFSTTRTAKALYLHQNTVKYRVAQISDLLGLDLGTLEGRAQVWIALTVASKPLQLDERAPLQPHLKMRRA